MSVMSKKTQQEDYGSAHHAMVLLNGRLRIPDSYDAKIAKNLQSLDTLACKNMLQV